MENSARTGKPIDKRAIDNVAQEIQQVDTQEARRVYDSPSKASYGAGKYRHMCGQNQ